MDKLILPNRKLWTRREASKLFGWATFFGLPTTQDPDYLSEFYPSGAVDNLQAGYSAGLQGRTQRDGRINPAQRTLVLAIFGQSNACNVNPSNYVPTNASVTDNFYIYNRGVYAAATPLLGCSGSTLGPGNPFIRLADGLITSSIFDRVILAPAAIGATVVSQWALDSFQRIAVTGQRFKEAGYLGSSATIAVAYQQGETDTSNGTSQSTYAASLATFIAAIRLWHTGPIFIAESTWNGTIVSAGIQAAQIASWTNVPNGIWSLGNMDVNTTTWRQGAGNPHLNDTGAAGWATAMQTALHAYGAPF